MGTVTWTAHWADDDDMMESGYIPVRKGDLIEILNDGSLVSGAYVPLYDDSKNLMGYTGGNVAMTNCYYIPVDAAYCRIPMVAENKDTYIVRRRLYPEVPTTSSTTDTKYVLTVTVNANKYPVFAWESMT